jgi:hypothetical protein
MKNVYYKILLIVFICTGCKTLTIKNTIKTEPVKLLIHNYPVNNSKEYSIDSGILFIRFINKTTNEDSLLLKKRLNFHNLQKYLQKLKELKNNRYENKCFQDGQVLEIFIGHDSSVKSLYFSNYYEPSLYNFINYLNSKLNSSQKIYFDKAGLINGMRLCK